MPILVTPHNKQEEKVLNAFLDSLNYEYNPEPGFGKRKTIEAYNKELEDALANMKAGKSTTQEQLEKEMQSW